MISMPEIPSYDLDYQRVFRNGTEVINGVETYILEIRDRTATDYDVNEERQRRISLGMSHRGKIWQIDLESRNLISGAVQAAILYKAGGGLGTEVQWLTSGEDMTWTAIDNSYLTFTPDEMIAFGMAVAGFINTLHKAGRAIKDTVGGIPSDYKSSTKWPAQP